MVSARKAYSAILYLRDNATIENLMYYTDLKRSILYYTLKKLVERGFSEKERVGRKVVYRIAKPLNISELTAEIDKIRDDDVYKLARLVRGLMEVYDIEGDLIGSSKIHIETYPHHLAIFPFIEAVITREHFISFANMLIDCLNAEPGFTDSYRVIVLSPRGILGGIMIHLYCDGVIENDRVLWNLRKYLKKEKRLTLKHAIVIDLIKREWNRNDRDDVFIGMKFVNPPRLFELLRDAVEPKLWLIMRVRNHLKELVRYAMENFPDTLEAVESIARKINKLLNDIETSLKVGNIMLG